MREILFKAKRIDNGEWIEGNLVFLFPKKVHEAFIIPIKFGNAFMQLREGDLGFRYWYKVDKETLCQFTGLCDKNGNKIWENDILRFTQQDETKIDVIKYNAPIFTYFGLMRWSLYKDEVIGNIFDNPELLQEEHK